MEHRIATSATSARRVRPVLALLAIVALALAACTSGGASPAGTPPAAAVPLEGTSWQLTQYVGAAGAIVRIPKGVVVTAVFSGARLSGNAGCNTYGADYALDGASIAITDVAATAMACTGAAGPVDAAYLAILPKLATYTISGSNLEMQNSTGTISLSYKVGNTP
jgi:heat shock protein HslJ